jgi:hypothetical protein
MRKLVKRSGTTTAKCLNRVAYIRTSFHKLAHVKLLLSFFNMITYKMMKKNKRFHRVI